MGRANVCGKPGGSGKRVLTIEDFLLEAIPGPGLDETLMAYFPEGVVWKDFKDFVYSGKHYTSSDYRAGDVVKKSDTEYMVVRSNGNFTTLSISPEATEIQICYGRYISIHCLFATLK